MPRNCRIDSFCCLILFLSELLPIVIAMRELFWISVNDDASDASSLYCLACGDYIHCREQYFFQDSHPEKCLFLYSSKATKNFRELIAASALLIGLSADRRLMEAALKSSWPLAIMMMNRRISMDHTHNSRLYQYFPLGLVPLLMADVVVHKARAPAPLSQFWH